MQPVLGLKQNWKQFSLLVLINAFVGATVGMERSIFPDFALEIFGLESHMAMLTFIVAFGVSKAITNYFSGKFSNRYGRKNLLIFGWLLVLPVPFILNLTGSWSWVIFANSLLGISQGLTWSSTVVMKIDLVGEKNRGLAMGLNEFAGYLALGISAVISAYLTSNYGLRPIPFWTMGGIALMGLLLSFWAKETKEHVKVESSNTSSPKVSKAFWNTTVSDKTLSSVTQAGLVNNLNDGMIWGLLPVLLVEKGFNLEEIGSLAAVYPVVWGFGQLFTGKMSDHFSKKKMLFIGMLLQGFAIIALGFVFSKMEFIVLLTFLGIGTAIVYPTFLATVASATHPQDRAEVLGVFRFWRDLGYAVGALISGIVADQFGIVFSIIFIGILTVISGLIIEFRMPRIRLDN
ncbi:putative MFS family arabinose efflux permease [Algoriphagus boseongensis]|uniref:Putative MFS family arabinose efflux permease n=1 Tax=Algoriphagus boseongensis TaxID=1442587 RepID=A0A4R6T7G7_9BACT|nr:MFS transporter [Algoriphagus boseongensis]TDQ18960.1 putative MFS family arabinose efflux permease [Algoriphagus boseongensis]